MKTKAFLKSRDQRKRVEMRFAHLKTHHGFERLRLRGLSGARDEFHLAAIVQNQKPWLSGSSGYHQNPRMRKLRCRDVSVVARATPPRSAEAKDPNPLGYFASTHQQSLAALTADFFDSIGHPETVRILGRR